MAAEREQACLVALDKRLERAVVATAHERDQSLVALKPQKRRPTGQRG